MVWLWTGPLSNPEIHSLEQSLRLRVGLALGNCQSFKLMAMADMKIKLVYFDGRGRAEVIRQILASGGIDFEDLRIPSEEWSDFEKRTPWGQLPILEFEGETLAQTMTICRFVSKKAGLAGNTALEQAQIDMVADKCDEYLTKLYDIHTLADDNLKEKTSKHFLKEYVPKFLKDTEALLKQRGHPFFGGIVPSYADIILAEYLNGLTDPEDPFIVRKTKLDTSRLNLLEKYPKIKSLVKSVRSSAPLKLYLEARPSSQKEQF